MNYANKIFKMLGVKPNERFKLRNIADIEISCRSYPAGDWSDGVAVDGGSTWFIDNDLHLRVADSGDKVSIGDSFLRHILSGQYKIIKILKPTSNEQLAIDYAKACGYEWLARDKNNVGEEGCVYAYKHKPEKSQRDIWQRGGKSMLVEIPITFLSYEDEEPYYIGGDK